MTKQITKYSLFEKVCGKWVRVHAASYPLAEAQREFSLLLETRQRSRRRLGDAANEWELRPVNLASAN